MSQPEHELLDEPSKYYVDRFGNEIYSDYNGDLHNPFGPALITKNSESWYKHGKLHRVDGYAVEREDGTKEYWIEGEKVTEEEFNEEQFPILEQPQIDEFGTEIWRNKDGEEHRDDDLPAVTFENGTKYFYKNGKIHRLNGPAILYANGNKSYWIEGILLTEDEFNESKDWEQFEPEVEYDLRGDPIPKIEEPVDEPVLFETDDSGMKSYRNERGQIHREDGPAVIYASGNEMYYLKGKPLTEKEYYKIPRIDEQGNTRWFNKDGKLHRDDDLPAVEMENGYKAWYQNGERHRNGEPAVIYSDGTYKWYIDGKHLEHRDLVKELISPQDINTGRKRWGLEALEVEEPDFNDEIMKRVEKLKGLLAKEIEEAITETLFKPSYPKMTDYGSSKRWRNKEGQLHRLDGPAIERPDGTPSYYIDGEAFGKIEFKEITKKLSEPEPEIDELGTKVWKKDGKYHRENGPAIVHLDGTMQWFKHGRRHRIDGPAIIRADGSKKYFVDGKEYLSKEFKRYMSEIPTELRRI